MKRLIKRILREEIEKSDKHYSILDKISDYVELPYFKSMEGLTIYDEDDQEYIMKKILGNIYIKRYYIYDERGNKIYWELSDGEWLRSEYDDRGNRIYWEDSSGKWRKWEYDDKGKLIYYETSGYWEKREYDNRGKLIYYEDSDGYIDDRR